MYVKRAFLVFVFNLGASTYSRPRFMPPDLFLVSLHLLHALNLAEPRLLQRSRTLLPEWRREPLLEVLAERVRVIVSLISLVQEADPLTEVRRRSVCDIALVVVGVLEPCIVILNLSGHDLVGGRRLLALVLFLRDRAELGPVSVACLGLAAVAVILVLAHPHELGGQVDRHAVEAVVV